MAHTTEEKKKLRPLYNELQGYLSQTPTSTDVNALLFERSQWEHVNTAIDSLNAATGTNYDQFKIIETRDSDGYVNDVRLSTLRTKLGGLISRLHAEYFSDELPPFSGSPSSPRTVINNQNSQQQSQQQHQEQKIELEQMVKNAQEMIQAEYGEEQAKKASDLIKQIISNPKNWAIIATSIIALAHIGHVAFVAALPILGKILLEKAPVHTA